MSGGDPTTPSGEHTRSRGEDPPSVTVCPHRFSLGAVGVRPVMPEDLPAVLAMKNAVWRIVYADVLPAEEFDRLDAGLPDQVDGWRRNLAAPEITTVLAETADGTVVGMASSGPARPIEHLPDAADGEGGTAGAVPALELFAIYVLPSQQGTGLADRLMAATVGTKPARLRVLDGNARAEAFYRRHGFEALGDPVLLGPPWQDAAERRYVRR